MPPVLVGCGEGNGPGTALVWDGGQFAGHWGDQWEMLAD